MAEGMVFLPDETEIELSGGVGIAAAPISALQTLASAARSESTDEAYWRGMLAFCLLHDAWGGEGRITVRTIAPSLSGFSAAVLAAPVDLVLWENGEQRHVLGVLSAQKGIVPAAQRPDMKLDPRVTWFDGSFADPTEMLCERDRTILLSRLSALNQQGEGCVQRFISALTQRGLRAAQAAAHNEDNALGVLLVRMKAILGEIPGVEAEKAAYASAGKNPILDALKLEQRQEPLSDAMTWRYRGVAFARSNSAIFCEETNHPREEEALSALAGEISLLERYSTPWREKLAKNLNGFLAQHREDRAMLPAVRALAEEAAALALEEFPKENLRLTWPWKADGAERLLWHEALGETMDKGMEHPFADQLCLLPGGAWSVLGDPLLSRLCVLPGTAMEPPSAVIPPLSAALAACAGDSLISESFMFRYTEDGGVAVSFALRGQETAVLERVYAPEEIRRLSMDETPTVAVWPALPLPEKNWKAYYVYLHGGTLRACALQAGKWVNTEDRLFSVIKTDAFPTMIALMENGRCLGVLPNQLPPCIPPSAPSALGLMDVGASGVTLALGLGDAAEPVRLPGLVRTLMRGAKAAPLSEEFLPAAPMGPMLPSGVELFNDAEEPLPLVDGHILMPESSVVIAAHDAKNMHCAWKWNVDAPSRRARRLMLHQAMLTASLAAVLKGAPSIAWRVALPEGMAAEGRRELWQEITRLAPVVAQSCGMPLAEPLVAHTDESLAMGTYFRGDGGVRGGFMVLDVGSGDVSMSLWLRGMNRPAVRCSLPLGVQSMLLDGLLAAPQALLDDFSDMNDPAAYQCVSLLASELTAAGSRKNMEKCRFLLDQCLAEHGHALSMHMALRFSQGRTTLTQSLILQAFAAMLSISGMVQEQVKRDPLLNDYLPMEMTYILTGRGSQLMNAMPEQLKAALSQFVRLEMSGDHPVRSLRFLFTGTVKCETVMGLARMNGLSTDAPGVPVSQRASVALPMPPDLLAMRFLSAFRSVFPQSAQQLYAALFNEAGLMTAQGEQAIRSAAARHFASTAEPEAALAACLAELRDTQDN